MGAEKSYRQTIDDTLVDIQSQTGKMDSKILFEKLENISKYRPLTTLYFNTLAELYFSEKRYDEVFSTLNSKEHWWYPSKYAAKSAEIFSKTFAKKGDTLHSNQYKILECYLLEVLKEEKVTKQTFEILEKSKEQIFQLQEQFVNSDTIPSCVKDMFILFTEQWRFAEAAIMLLVEMNFLDTKNVGYDTLLYTNEFKGFEPNMGFIFDQLANENGRTFLLIADNSNDLLSYSTLAKALALLGRKVTLIANTIKAEVESPIQLSDTVAISIENKEIIHGYELIRPIEIFCNGDSLGDNTFLVIAAILKNTEDEYMNLITTTIMFDSLSDSETFNMRVQCLSQYKGEYYSDFLMFGYIGKYTSYINRIYNINYVEELSKKSECEFSIVIPARNSAYTLQYTLQTCLEQRGMTDKDYEIVISDNSDSDNKDIYNLVQKLDNKKIKYFHTPRNLHLTRSFEFAFSKARGEFIIPIGSDDALLPWGLETLRRCIAQYPDDDIFAWKRGFFQWSESKTSDQPGRFVIPGIYKKNVYNVQELNCKKKLKEVLESDAYLYGMPLLYINSGFRRRYLKKVLNKTGRVLDGYSQDVFMGILTLLINDRYISIQHPITIAGMSDSSLGAKSLAEKVNNEDMIEHFRSINDFASFGVPIMGRIKFGCCDVDTALFWSQLLYFLENKQLNIELNQLLDGYDWNKAFKAIHNKLNVANFDYFISLNIMRGNAYALGQDIGSEYDKEIYNVGFEHMYEVSNIVKTESTYFTGFDNGLALDARKFGVSNVYEATKLFENIANL